MQYAYELLEIVVIVSRKIPHISANLVLFIPKIPAKTQQLPGVSPIFQLENTPADFETKFVK